MKYNYTSIKRYVVALTVFLLAIVQGARGDEVNVSMQISTAPDVFVNTQRYEAPSITLRAENGKMARAFYKLSYSFQGALGTDFTANDKDGDGYVIQTQTATGTQLDTHNGRIVKIGNKTGKVAVDVTAHVTNVYKGKYQATVTGSYSFEVKAPEAYTISVNYNGDPLTSAGVVKLTRGKTKYNSVKNLGIAKLSKPVVTYTTDNGMTVDVTKYFDVTLTADNKLKVSSNSDGSYTVEAGDAVTESAEGLPLSFTAKVKEGYRDTYGYNEAKTDGKAATALKATVDIKYLDGTGKIQTYLVFDRQELTKYKMSWKGNTGGDPSFKSPVYKIVDADGNDYTDAYVFQGATVVPQNAFYKYSQDPLDFGRDLKNGKGEPFESLINYPDLRVEHTDGCSMNYPQNHQSMGNAYIPDDYVITLNFLLPDYSEWSGVLSSVPATAKSSDKPAVVAGMFYAFNRENQYSVDKGHFVLHVLKRGPEISMIPDPETTPIAADYEMTSFNRFDLYGKFTDEKSDFKVGEDWTLHLGGVNNDNDFWYTYFVPNDVAWPTGLTDDESTALENSLNESDNLGTVLVKVDGSLTNEGRYLTDLQMSVPAYEEETMTIGGRTFTKYKTGADGKPIPVMMDDGTGHQIQKMEVKSGTMYISQREFGNDPNSWKVSFHGEGYVPVSYVVIPWNSTAWDVGSVSSHMFHVVKAEPVKFILDPKNFTVPVGNVAPAPSVKVVDNFGKDLTKYYQFDWAKTTDTDNQLTTLNDDHSSKGLKDGSATVKVTPSQVDDASKLEAWRQSDGWNPNVYERTTEPANDSYVVNVVGNAGTLAQYDIIYDSLGYYNGAKDANGKPEPDMAKRETSKMGKLHFVKTGDFYPGTTSVGETPGLTVTFGTGNDSDPWRVTTAGDAKTDGEFDDADGQPCVLEAGNVDFGGSNEPNEAHPTPVGGGFLKLEPYTSGFLTIDGRFGKKDEMLRYRLMDVNDNNYIQEVRRPSGLSDDATYGEAQFTYALLAGHTYYLWCFQNDNGFDIHGLLFKPAYVVMREDTQTITEASMFENGFTGDLPRLTNHDASPAVTFSETFSDWQLEKALGGATTKTKATDIVGIEDNYKFVANGNTMGERVRVRANVKGKVKTVNGSDKVTVARAPYIDIAVIALPMYKPAPDDVIFPGKRVTTTNFVTRMWMTWGGWEYDSELFPYYKTNVKDPSKSNNNVLFDNYVQAKSDTVGANGRTIDGFRYGSGLTGSSNPTDENVQAWNTSLNPNTFNLPVRGGYVKFEPEESGTLMAYVIQNGMTDLSDERPDNKTGEKDHPTELRRRAMYIVDEAGKPVDIADGEGEWSTIGAYFAKNDNIRSANKNYVTEGLLRCSWNDQSPIKPIREKGFNFNRWTRYYKDGANDEGYQHDVKEITDYWHVAKGAANDPYNKLMKVFKLSDGSFVTPTKAYVRYTFDVKAGKTYYMFQVDSKMNFAGFAFLPEGYTSHSAFWKECQVPADGEEYNPYNETDAKIRAELPEPDNSIYSQEVTTPGHEDITLNESGRNTINGKALGEASAEFVNVTVNRSFTPDKWTSICLPFSLSEYQVKHLFGTDAQVITFDSVMTAHQELVSPVAFSYDNPLYKEVKQRTVHFTKHVNQLMEAGRPYFIKPTFKVVDEETGTEVDPAGVTFNDDKTKVTAITFKHVSLEGVKKMDVSCANEHARQNVDWATDRLTDGSLTKDSVDYYNSLKDSKSIFEYRFSGTYDRQQVPWYSYIMGEKGSDNGLFRVVPSQAVDITNQAKFPYLKGFRAYLYPYRESDGSDIPDPLTITEKPAKVSISDLWITGAEVFGDNGSATGIEDIVSEMNQQLTNGVKGVFNLSGQMVRNTDNLNGLPAGIYIMNGHKYVIK